MLINPVPGTTRANNGGYPADSGLDILCPVGTLVVAAADGVLEYAEHGHTPWMEDTDLAKPGIQYPYSIRLRLDTPIVLNGRKYPWLWYTHMTRLAPGIEDADELRVTAGQPLGYSGIGNTVPHLHFGVIADRQQEITMPFQQIAALIWDKQHPDSDPGPGPSPAPAPAARHTIGVFMHDGQAALQIDGRACAIVDLSWEWKLGPRGALLSCSGIFKFVAPPAVRGPNDTHEPPPGMLKVYVHDGKGTAILYGQEYDLAELTEAAHAIPGKPSGIRLDFTLSQG